MYEPALTPALQPVPNPLSPSCSHSSLLDTILNTSTLSCFPFTLSGGLHFMEVTSSCRLFRLANYWGFTAFTICLGSSYFQVWEGGRVEGGSPVRLNPSAFWTPILPRNAPCAALYPYFSDYLPPPPRQHCCSAYWTPMSHSSVPSWAPHTSQSTCPMCAACCPPRPTTPSGQQRTTSRERSSSRCCR